MKTLLLSLIFLMGIMTTSCTSEYEERLEEGRTLIKRLTYLKERKMELSDQILKEEITRINNELFILAKLSGNETLFLTQLKKL